MWYCATDLRFHGLASIAASPVSEKCEENSSSLAVERLHGNGSTSMIVLLLEVLATALVKQVIAGEGQNAP